MKFIFENLYIILPTGLAKSMEKTKPPPEEILKRLENP